MSGEASTDESVNDSAIEPLVSTIVPTFNRRELVCRALDSALSQTYANQEVIVVDDGSTDGTGEYLRERYGEKLSYVYQPNGGVSSARNHGMRLAHGEMIALLDSDDEWEPTKLSRQVEFLIAHPDFGMVLTDVERVDDNGHTIDVFRRRDVIHQDGDVMLDVLQNPALVPASAMFRREVLDRVGGFDTALRTAEDVDFHLRVSAVYKIGVIDECLTIASRGMKGLSSEAVSNMDYVRVVEKFVKEHGDRIPRTVRRMALFSTYERNARSLFLSGRPAMAWLHTLQAARLADSPQAWRAIFRLAVLSAKVSIVKMARALRLYRR